MLGNTIFGGSTLPTTSTSSSFFNQQALNQPKTQAAEGTLQDVFQEIATLSAAVAGPELYGDERDGVISLLNKLLASAGVGSGYYRPDQQPFAFTINNIFHRLKGVGYNQLSKHKNHDGLVSLLLKISPSTLENAQEKQKAIDTINAVLQPKSTTSLLGQQSKPSATIRAEVRSIIPHGDQLTELVIVAREHGGPKHGILPATQLYNEIMQQDRINQLKQSLNCEKVVPHVEVDKSEIERISKNPPPGFEELWMRALKENPDPENLVPYPIHGFSQLVQRKIVQNSVVSAQLATLNNFADRLSHYEGEILNAHNKHVKCIQMQKQLSYRLIRILAAQTLIQRYGMMIDDKEEQLQSRLECLNAQLNAPGKLKEQVTDLYEILRRDGNSLRRVAQERQGVSVLKILDIKELGRCLSARQSLLESLVASFKSSSEQLKILEQNL